MKKSVMLAAVALCVISFNVNSAFAKHPCALKSAQACNQAKGEGYGAPEFRQGKMDPAAIEKMKKEHQKRKSEMDARLKLTEEQKKTIEDNRLKDREKMKPVFDKIVAKRQKIDEINNSSLPQAEKDKQINAIKCELKDLKTQANMLRDENMKNFESILTPCQKTEFEKMKQEHKNNMQHRKNKYKCCPHPAPYKD